MTTKNENWLLSQLSGMAAHFPAYELPTMARDENDMTQAAALDNLRKADEMRHEVETAINDRLTTAQQAAAALRNQIGNTEALIAEGKACLRAGESVRPECGAAGYLLPELVDELHAADQAVAAIELEKADLIRRATQAENSAERSLAELCRARRVNRIELLLKLAMNEAQALADEDNARTNIIVTPDPRLARLASYSGSIEILRTNRGIAR